MNRIPERIEVLIVDSDSQAAETILDCFDPQRYRCVTATRAEGALELLKRFQFSVAICALRLSGIDGLEFLRRGRIRSPYTNFLMLAGPSDSIRDAEAMKNGACDCLEKPFEVAELMARVEMAVDQHRSQVLQEIFQMNLGGTLHERAKHLHNILRRSGERHRSTLEMLVIALDTRDNYPNLHSMRVQQFSVLLAKRCGYPPERMNQLADGALLHDIGKIAIPESILLKPGKLTAQEFQVVKQHSRFGYQVLSRLPHLESAAMLALFHHERMDGTGYPMGLKGNSIPWEVRIFTVADTMDAIIAGRPYYPPRSMAQARAEILRCRGSQFDPEVVDVARTVSDEEWRAEIEEVSRRCAELLPLFPQPSERSQAFQKKAH